MKCCFFGIFVAVFFAVVPQFSLAATLYLEPIQAEIYPGDSIAVAVRLDTDEGECINVVDGVITFPDNIVPVDISLGNSILPVWVEEPRIDSTNKRITFAGGIPNGYCGRIAGDPRLTNTLLEIIFQAPGLRIGSKDVDPVARIDFTNESQVLLNDGAGTPAALRTVGADVTVYTTPSGNTVDEWSERVAEDDTPPNDFTISLQQDKSIYAGRYFIVFNTTDKQSGIDHYEVIEEPLDEFDLFLWGGVEAPWIDARSPYLLEDQSLNSVIRVRAFDKAGNTYVATLIPDESLRGMSERQQAVIVLTIAGVVVLLAVVVAVLVWYRRRRIDEVVDEVEEFDEDES